VTAMTGVFASISQLTVDIEKSPALARRVQKLWQTKNLWAFATEMYDRCYRSSIEALAAK